MIDKLRNKAAGGVPRQLFVFNGGMLRGRVRRILELSGWAPRLGIPKASDSVGIWGSSPTSWRGKAVASRYSSGIVRIEDAFLRSILPGRANGPTAQRGPIGLIIDPCGVHFDADHSSLIEILISSGASTLSHDKVRAAIARLIDTDLSKYNAHLPDIPPPEPGYVLIIDQTMGDASLMGAGRDVFLNMLAVARAENPDKQIILRSHPETARGLRNGHFTQSDLRPGEILYDAAVSPWRLLEGASAVYAVSSQLGYEAMLRGHRPRLFGRPFYAGWELSDDEHPIPRRGKATIEGLFAASHLIAPVWYDPCRDRLTDFDGVINQLEAEAKVWRQDHAGHLAYGMRLWKRPFLARAFGSGKPIRFTSHPLPGVTLAWAGRAAELPSPHILRVEDGFLRSRGLGAALTPPISLVADDLGIYYDPTRPSRIETLIAAPLPPGGAVRARKLRDALISMGLSKYNLQDANTGLPPQKEQKRILVPGQVEDDASIRLGAGLERRNIDLLSRTRIENPDAFIVYKPHPDVEAGLRPGLIPREKLDQLADHVAQNADPIALLKEIDEVWTITSTLGFEALLRDIPVTTLGAPFYAGWGLSNDLGPIPSRRKAQPDLDALTYAALIAYPRYTDPVSQLPCPPEVALERLTDPALRHQGHRLRILAKLQGAFAGHAWIWRR